MRFLTDDATLSVTALLDTEPESVDLTEPQEDGRTLGDQLLDLAVTGMLETHGREQAPDGTPWAPLRPSTVRQKPGLTKGLIGIRTGDMLDPDRFDPGRREIAPRSASWFYRHDGEETVSFAKARGFNDGRPGVQEPRPLVGWTDGARLEAQSLIQAASFRADP